MENARNARENRTVAPTGRRLSRRFDRACAPTTVPKTLSRNRSSAAALATGAGQQLAVELGRAKRARGLSFTTMAAEIPYSRASLERYVNGKIFPPRRAVHDIALVCRTDAARLLTLWDAADTASQSKHSARERHSQHLSQIVPSRRDLLAATGLLLALTLLLLIEHLRPRNRHIRLGRPPRPGTSRDPDAIWSAGLQPFMITGTE